MKMENKIVAMLISLSFVCCPSGRTEPPYDGGYDAEVEEGYEAEIVVQCEGEGTQCDDKNPCTYDDKCVNGHCIGIEKKCDDNNQCTNDYCNLENGECKYVSLNDNAACDDGNICTEGDKCLEGVCKSGENKCDCKGDADCANFEDNDFCNGTLYCNDSYKCEIKPSTVVVCSKNNDTDCMKNQCVKSTGKCEMTPVNEDGECEDENKCTVGDKCKAGECKSGAMTQCDDGNPCTKDYCDGKTGDCKTLNMDDGTECNTGACLSGGKCVGGKCEGEVKIYDCCEKDADCDDGYKCTEEKCNVEVKMCERKSKLFTYEGCGFQASYCTGLLCDDGECKLEALNSRKVVYNVDFKVVDFKGIGFEPDISWFTFSKDEGAGLASGKESGAIHLPAFKLPNGSSDLEVALSGNFSCSKENPKVMVNGETLDHKTCKFADGVEIRRYDLSKHLNVDIKAVISIVAGEPAVKVKGARIINFGVKDCPFDAGTEIDGSSQAHFASVSDGGGIIAWLTKPSDYKLKWRVGDFGVKELADTFEISQKFTIYSASSGGSHAIVWGGAVKGVKTLSNILFLDSDGNALGQEKALSDASDLIITPHLIGANGKFLAVFAAYNNANGSYDISYAVYNGDGSVAKSEVTVNETTTKNQQYPFVVFHGESGMIFWEHEGTTYEIKGRKIDNELNINGPEFDVVKSDTISYLKPSAAQLATGDIVVAFETYDPSSYEKGVSAKIISSEGQTIKPLFNATIETENDQLKPLVISSPLGGFVVGYISDAEIKNTFAARLNFFSSDGDSFSTTGSTLCDDCVASGAFYSDQGYKVLYIDKLNQSKLFVKHIGVSCYDGSLYCEGTNPKVCKDLYYDDLAGGCNYGDDCEEMCK